MTDGESVWVRGGLASKTARTNVRRQANHRRRRHEAIHCCAQAALRDTAFVAQYHNYNAIIWYYIHFMIDKAA
jgi:hypothetical protein